MALNRWYDNDPLLPVLGALSAFDQWPYAETGYMNNMRQMDRQMRNLQRDMDHMFAQGQRHFGMSPMNFREAEASNIINPVVTDKDGTKKLQYKLDVRQFKPEEIAIRTKDNQLEIHAKHEENTEHGRVHREYKRVCLLPKEVDPHALVSQLGNDGVLCIEAPLSKAIEQAKEHTIPITHEKSK